jgi:catechol 2,3-dioxygenase-like lactoylglutathione lyase family enzyme
MQDSSPRLTFEGIVGYSVAETEEAVHFFEHTLGLPLAGEDGALRFYALGEGLSLAVEVSSALAGQPPYLLFSTVDLTAAAEHFLQRGCQVGGLSWASGSGFIARAPEGHTVCVVDAGALDSAAPDAGTD